MANIRLETTQQKEIYNDFRYLSDRYGKWETWADFIRLSACSLCLSNREEKEREYADAIRRYQQEDIERFSRMLALTIDALEQNPNQDFLGDLFMRFDLSNTWKGQFFTPYNVCEAIAEMTAEDLADQLKNKPWVSINDPACGAGALLIAFAQECRRQKVNYQQSVLFVAQDVDRTAALMCFIQLSLLGCAGYVVVGNSLLNPIVGPSVLLPAKQDGQEIWYMPMMYTDMWQYRLALEKIKCATKTDSTTGDYLL